MELAVAEQTVQEGHVEFQQEQEVYQPEAKQGPALHFQYHSLQNINNKTNK